MILAIIIKGHKGLTNMLAEGIGDCREKDLELYGQETPLEKLEISKQISREVEFQKFVGISQVVIILYFLFLVVAYGLLGPIAFFGLFSIPAQSNI